MTFGAQADEAASIKMVQQALDAGINFIDTADIYNKGLTETIVGKALAGKREGVVLVSKVRNQVGEYKLKDDGLSRWHIIRGVEASLRRLQTDCLDILFLHRPDYDTPLEESLSAVDHLIRQGKIMYYGMSNYAAWQVCQAKWLAERHGLAAPVVVQCVYNVITRGAEPELLAMCRTLQAGVMVYNPLAGGLLTGKHDPAKAPSAGTRFQLNKEYFGRYWQDDNFKALAELTELAHAAGKTMVQLAIQWLLAQDTIDSIILGASRSEQLAENIAAADGALDQATLNACDTVWKGIRGTSFQYHR
jgi:aryl-alcohol dehydrogenase-like predicted oxidoreductase